MAQGQFLRMECQQGEEMNSDEIDNLLDDILPLHSRAHGTVVAIFDSYKTSTKHYGNLNAYHLLSDAMLCIVYQDYRNALKIIRHSVEVIDHQLNMGMALSEAEASKLVKYAIAKAIYNCIVQSEKCAFQNAYLLQTDQEYYKYAESADTESMGYHGVLSLLCSNNDGFLRHASKQGLRTIAKKSLSEYDKTLSVIELLNTREQYSSICEHVGHLNQRSFIQLFRQGNFEYIMYWIAYQCMYYDQQAPISVVTISDIVRSHIAYGVATGA